MARSSNQKLKLLYLLRYLLKCTDETHPASTAELLAELERQGVGAERKSLYDDLEALRLYGLDVEQAPGRRGWFVASRDFELAELKLLVDSVQSSKFITEKKTLSLIKKIEGLASEHDAQLLQRQVYVRGRVKSMNESVYYNVDEISAAINADRAIRFKYFEYALDKSRRYRRGGGAYEVSPYALIWDDENYYMLAYEAASASLRHYRVDKMSAIEALPQPREGKEAFAALDMSSYTKKVFGMFSGQVQRVKLRMDRRLVGAVIDRFGRDTLLVPDGEEHFTVSAEVAVSPQFYGWLLGFGALAELLEPKELRQAFAEELKQVGALYAEDAQ